MPVRINVERQRPRLATAILLLALSLLPQTARAQEDWDFTPADLDALTAGGGDLTFGPDSDWFPDNLKDNLKKTIRKVLKPDPNDPNAPKSDGVNVRDWYHGHVVCPRPCPKAHTDAVDEYHQNKDKTIREAIGDGMEVTAENLERYSEAVKKVELAARTLLDGCWKDGCVAIYHTYEVHRPEGMRAGDPRRNVLTPKDGEPGPYQPPDPDSAGSFLEDYCHCLQFAFLISQDGRIHVTISSIQELSTVTGRPMP